MRVVGAACASLWCACVCVCAVPHRTCEALSRAHALVYDHCEWRSGVAVTFHAAEKPELLDLLHVLRLGLVQPAHEGSTKATR